MTTYQINNFSKTITALKTPLIFIVVLSHVNNIYNDIIFFREVITIITKAVIPTFFIISGYFLLKGSNSFTLQIYKTKLKSRFKTLFIPYIFWNIFPILLPITLCLITSLLEFNIDKISSYLKEVLINDSFNPYKLFWDKVRDANGFYPVNFPMWYIRDLMVAILISPFPFILIKYLKIYSLLILFTLLYLNLPFLNAIFFTSLGMFLSINKVDFIELAHKRRWIILPVFIVLFVWLYSDMSIHIIERIYLLIGPFALFSIISITPAKLFSFFYGLSKYSFFVYAIHATYIYRIDKIIFNITPNNTISHLMAYILVAITAYGMGIIGYSLLKTISPKTLSILSGNRNK